MVSDELQHQVRRSWYDYGEAIKSAFRFPATAQIGAEGLEDFFQAGTDDAARSFISYVRQQIGELRSMKFVGEK
jgi:hypothetical protein